MALGLSTHAGKPRQNGGNETIQKARNLIHHSIPELKALAMDYILFGSGNFSERHDWTR